VTSPTRWCAAAGLAAVLVTTGCTGTGSTGAASKPAAVALAAPGLPGEVTIGVIVSLSSLPGEGSDWSQAAEGAQVAAYRYRLGGAKVTIKAVDDKGSDDGAVAAVGQLVQAGAAGIVVASDGSHVDAALTAAGASGTPVVLPYTSRDAGLSGAAWATGPSAAAITRVLGQAANGAGAANALVVDAGGAAEAATSDAVTVSAQDDEAAIVAAVKAGLKGSGHDGLLVTGSAAMQARVVRAVQGASIALPLVLGPEATSPAFATTLGDNNGSLSGDFSTVGVNSGDTVALQADADGAAMSAFLAALRAAAADGQVKDFFDGDQFAKVAPAADSRSHDAVVALVNAAAKAGSAKPADVAKALTGLSLTHDQGLAGPPLAFSSPAALSDEAVVALRASTKDTGLRPESESGTSQLYWFKAPSS
jgi:hypothetical protein